MGKTVESYRLALDIELHTWNGFAQALRTNDRQAFQQMADACRNHASAGSNSTRPELFEPMIMSILLEQQKRLMRLEKELIALKQKPSQP